MCTAGKLPACIFLPVLELPARPIEAALLLFCVPTTHRFPESFAALHSQSLCSLAYSRFIFMFIFSHLYIIICALLPLLWLLCTGRERQRIMAMAFTSEVDSSLNQDARIRKLDDGWIKDKEDRRGRSEERK